MDIRYTRVWAQRYGHGMHAWSKLAPRYVCAYAAIVLLSFLLRLLLVTRGRLSDRCSCSHGHPPVLNRTSTVLAYFSFSHTRGTGVAVGLILIRNDNVVVLAFISVYLWSAYTVLGIAWLASPYPTSWGGRYVAHYVGIYVAPVCWSKLTVPELSLLYHDPLPTALWL